MVLNLINRPGDADLKDNEVPPRKMESWKAREVTRANSADALPGGSRLALPTPHTLRVPHGSSRKGCVRPHPAGSNPKAHPVPGGDGEVGRGAAAPAGTAVLLASV